MLNTGSHELLRRVFGYGRPFDMLSNEKSGYTITAAVTI